VSDFLDVYGRLHPLVLHLPIGMLVALALLELAVLFAHLELGRRALGLLVSVTALSALLAASTGWVLGQGGDYDGEVFFRHRNLGLAVAGASVVFALLHGASSGGQRPGLLRAYRAFLFLSTALLVPAGHLGATLTHGAGFLLGGQAAPETAAPKATPQAEAPAAPSSATFATTILPIFQERCSACHGETKRKGKLALHDAASILKGGSLGPVFVPGDPAQSEMVHRLRLPLSDEEHMPPEGKPQPTEEEIRRIEAWISAGAPFDGPLALVPAPGTDPDAGPGSTGSLESSGAAPIAAEPALQPSAEALAALAAARVHVERLDPLAGGLWIDFTALAADTDDALARPLLEPVTPFVAQLGLARTRVGAGMLELAARMPALARLDLRAAPIDDAALAVLRGHAALQELVLAQTQLSDASVETLLSLPALERVVLWQSGITSEGRARLAQERPELSIEAGDTPDSAALETEGELVFTSDRPLPGAEAAGADPLAAVNTTCPVSGSPVNPKYRVVYGGKVIGFCCPECPKAFWADPHACLTRLK